jgi:hypothetical protein
VARRVAHVLGSDDCLLVGGLAVGAHGYVRATKDVDFVARISLSEAQKRFRERSIAASVKHGDFTEGDFPCLQANVDGVRVDVMPPLVPIEWERSIEVALTRTEHLRVIDLDGLLRLKLRAGGPKDLMDAAVLMLRHPETLARGRELAVAYGAADRLEAWLTDPRLRMEVEQTEAGERIRTPARRTRSRPRPRRRRPPREG